MAIEKRPPHAGGPFSEGVVLGAGSVITETGLNSRIPLQFNLTGALMGE